MSLELTKDEFKVSAVELEGDDLLVRFMVDASAGRNASVFELMAKNASGAESICTYLRKVQHADVNVFIYERNESLVISAGGDDEVAMRSESVAIRSAEPNAAEFERFLARARELHEHDNKVSDIAFAKLEVVRKLLKEQFTRVQVKARSHSADSAAGVVYRQHLQFMLRLLQELEGHASP